MSNDIAPGPASIGSASGVKVMSDRVIASSLTFFFIPLCLLKDPVSKANPEDAMTNPPAIFRKFKLMPKNERRYFPAIKEINKIISTLTEVLKAMPDICCLDLPSVNLIKIGIVPKGLITENNELKLNRNRFIFFCKSNLPVFRKRK